jgi:hypothetical protein
LCCYKKAVTIPVRVHVAAKGKVGVRAGGRNLPTDKKDVVKVEKKNEKEKLLKVIGSRDLYRKLWLRLKSTMFTLGQ